MTLPADVADETDDLLNLLDALAEAGVIPVACGGWVCYLNAARMTPAPGRHVTASEPVLARPLADRAPRRRGGGQAPERCWPPENTTLPFTIWE
jgi:hypothetical protein